MSQLFGNKSLENLINEAKQELMEERERDNDMDIYMDMNMAEITDKQLRNTQSDYLEMEKVQKHQGK